MEIKNILYDTSPPQKKTQLKRDKYNVCIKLNC